MNLKNGIISSTFKLSSSVAPAMSPLLRSSPEKKVVMTKTPLSPFTNDPNRAKKLGVAKLKVEISELNMAMDKAVEAKNFLKAHETKQSIQKLEVEIKDIGISVKQSLSDVSGVTPKATLSTKDFNLTPSKFKKLTFGVLVNQEEIKKKRETETQAKREALVKEKLAKKEADKDEKDRQKDILKRAKEAERFEKEKFRNAVKEKQEAEKEKLKQEKEEERWMKKAARDAELKLKEEKKLNKFKETKQQKEAEKVKIRKKAEDFKSLFKKDYVVKKLRINGKEVEQVEEAVGKFTLFRVLDNMRLAPTVRSDTDKAKKRIDGLDMPSGPDGLYLALLKTDYTPGHQTKTWPYDKNDEGENVETEVIEESDPDEKINLMGSLVNSTTPRAKLIQFYENRRPAFWGTWTKKSQLVSGRRPFGKDEDRFDYDYGSDEDWDDEEEGDSLSDNEDDKEKEENMADYEVDNEFFVATGYLSDEEEEMDEVDVFNPVIAKEKAKEKRINTEREFEEERKKKTQKLMPRLWGVCFEEEIFDAEATASDLDKILGGFGGILAGNHNAIETGFSNSVSTHTAMHGENTKSAVTHNSSKRGKVKNVPDVAVPQLIKLLHGNNKSKMFLAREFIEFWKKTLDEEKRLRESKVDKCNAGKPGGKDGGQSTISKRGMIAKIQEIADFKMITGGSMRCWCVKQDILTEFKITPAPTNDWSYILEQPSNKSNATVTDDINTSMSGSPVAITPVAPNPAILINKFIRVMTDEEEEKQKANQEKEALLERLRGEAAKAEQIAKEAKLKAVQAAAAAKIKAEQAAAAAAAVVQVEVEAKESSIVSVNQASPNREMNSSRLDMSSARTGFAGTPTQTINRSSMHFPHLPTKTRKREDSIGGTESITRIPMFVKERMAMQVKDYLHREEVLMQMYDQSGSVIVDESNLGVKDCEIILQINERLGVAPETTIPFHLKFSPSKDISYSSCPVKSSSPRAENRTPKKMPSLAVHEIDLISSIIDEIVKAVVEQAVLKKTSPTEEFDNFTHSKTLKRKSSHVSSVCPKKSKLDSFFDSLFLTKHREEDVGNEASVNGDKDINKKNRKFNSIFDSVLGKLKKSAEDDPKGKEDS